MRVLSVATVLSISVYKVVGADRHFCLLTTAQQKKKKNLENKKIEENVLL